MLPLRKEENALGTQMDIIYGRMNSEKLLWTQRGHSGDGPEGDICQRKERRRLHGSRRNHSGKSRVALWLGYVE